MTLAMTLVAAAEEKNLALQLHKTTTTTTTNE